MKTYQLFLFLPLTLALTGCGQTGPLYLPTKATPVQVQPEPKPEPKKDQ